MQSKIDLLRQHFTELEAKYVKIKVEKVELETQNAEIPELRKKVAEIEAENAKLRHIIEENAKRDAENAEHKARIEELEKIVQILQPRMLNLRLELQNWKISNRKTN